MGLSIKVNVDEDRHLEDDYISNKNYTDLEEDEFFEHCLMILQMMITSCLNLFFLIISNVLLKNAM